MKQKIAILGAGFTGLTSAYYLSQKKNCEVFLFEKEDKPGGLAKGFKQNNWQWSLEESYHHLFASDNLAINLAKKMSIESIFKRPLTATYTRGKIFPLDSPISLLNYPYLTLWERLKTGLNLAYLKLIPSWEKLEKVSAKDWLIKAQGLAPWTELWEPLFKGKFGKDYDQISASWFWARIKKRSVSLGYPEGGFQVFAQRLAEKIKKQGGKIYYNCEVQKTSFNGNDWLMTFKNLKKLSRRPCDVGIPTEESGKIENCKLKIIITTLPTPIYLSIFPQLPQTYIKKLSSISHLYSLNLILELNKPFLPSLNPRSMIHDPSSYPYWLNINDPSFPFLAVVEHTNFMDKEHYGNHHLLYIGNYLPQNHPYLKKSANELFHLYQPYLLKINPIYDLRSTIHHLFIQPFSQPVVTTKYADIRPTDKTPLPNLYLGNLDCVYPWDRGVNYAIELGKKLADLPNRSA